MVASRANDWAFDTIAQQSLNDRVQDDVLDPVAMSTPS